MSAQEPVIFGMAADPEPDHLVMIPHGKRPVVQPDAR